MFFVLYTPQVLQRKAAESAKKRGNSKNRIKAVTTQIAPFAIPVSVSSSDFTREAEREEKERESFFFFLLHSIAYIPLLVPTYSVYASLGETALGWNQGPVE